MDATLFARQIAPACGIRVRYVGEEPIDPMTAAYNEAMLSILPANGVDVRVIRRKTNDGEPISASRVRALWKSGDFEAIRPLVPQATLDYMMKNSLRA
jgi:[citrate (pro-3S)-lyase] ligase